MLNDAQNISVSYETKKMFTEKVGISTHHLILILRLHQCQGRTIFCLFTFLIDQSQGENKKQMLKMRPATDITIIKNSIADCEQRKPKDYFLK